MVGRVEYSVIRALEEKSLRAWPALVTVDYSGWILRRSAGYTRRANSVYPLYASDGDMGARIRYCEVFYGAHGQETCFKMTAAVQPENLDAMLESRGYARLPEASVQRLDLTSKHTALSHLAVMCDHAMDTWLETYLSLNSQVDPRHLATKRRMLAMIEPQTCFMQLRQRDDVLAAGLGVRDGDLLWLFDVVTAPDRRRQGHGKALVASLLAWGQAQGAAQAYLQVAADNTPALGLYARAGFREVYRYWYCVKRTSG